MARPKDRGDQYPSDTGDVAPLNPSDGLVQRDFEPTGIGRKAFNVRQNQRVYNSSTGVPNPPVPTQQTWSGLIQEYVGFNQYEHSYRVIRYDGKSVIAKQIGFESMQQLELDTSVSIFRNLNDESYSIVGIQKLEHFAYWAELTEELPAAPLPEEFGPVSISDAKLYYYDGTRYVTVDAGCKVQNPTQNVYQIGTRFQVQLVTEQDTNDLAIWEPLFSTNNNGVGLVTQQITAASFDSGTGRLTYGRGMMKVFVPVDGEDYDELAATESLIETTISEVTPVDKIIQFKTANGRTLLDVEPCNAESM